MKFKIKDLVFYTKQVPCKPGEIPEYKAWVMYADRTHLCITNELGVGPSNESGCCYQILIWIERIGI